MDPRVLIYKLATMANFGYKSIAPAPLQFCQILFVHKIIYKIPRPKRNKREGFDKIDKRASFVVR